MRTNQLAVFTGNANRELGRAVARLLGTPLGQAHVGRFEDGEVNVVIKQNVRGKDVFIIQPTQPPAEHTIELQDLIDGARSARRVVAVIPYLGCSRGDRQTVPRQPVPVVRALRNILGAKPNHVVFFDLHAGQIGSMAKAIDESIHRDYLYARSAIMHALVQMLAKDELARTTLSSTDAGGAKWVSSYVDHMREEGYAVELGVGDKRGSSSTGIENMQLLGNFRDRHIVFVDDLSSTGKTLSLAAHKAISEGAIDVYAVIIHPVIANEEACRRIAASPIRRFITTDTLPIPENFRRILGKKLKVVTIAPIMALAIRAIHEERSVSALFDYGQYVRALHRLHQQPAK